MTRFRRSRIPALVFVSLAALSGVAYAAPTAAELRVRAQEAYGAKQFASCAELYDQAAKLAKRPDEDDGYSAACCRALAGQTDAAFAALDRAIAAGLHDSDDLEGDDDLVSLRKAPQWKGLIERIKAKQTAYLANVNRELYELFREDQADRRGGFNKVDWKLVGPRDERRRKRTIELVDHGQAKVSADYFHAALVLQHGQGVEDIARAHKYAVRAVELDDSNTHARWLAAAAEDRWLRRQGKLQKYGTQFEVVNGKWELAPVDPHITDLERAEWNVPPLSEARRRAQQMAPPPGPPSSDGNKAPTAAH